MAVQWLRLRNSKARSMVLIPGQGTKILHSTKCSQKTKQNKTKQVKLSFFPLVCCCSVAKLCPTLCNPVDCSTPGFPFLHVSRNLVKLISIESMIPSTHLILCHPLLLLPSIFPSITVFSNESALHIRWPKYWSLCIVEKNIMTSSTMWTHCMAPC